MVKQYLDHSKFILTNKHSTYKPNRTGVDTISRFGYQNEYDLSEGFPLLTTKKTAMKSITHELIWFLRGETNIKYLVDNNVHIWTDNAFEHYLRKTGVSNKDLPMYSEKWLQEKENYSKRIKEDEEFANQHGDLGPVYGSQWRQWKTTDGKTIDQIADVVNLLKNSPRSRRIIVTAWNPQEVPNVALPPCHVFYQFNVRDGKLDCQLYQRSCDMFLGVPFNIASYSMLTQIMAQEANLELGNFIHSFGDAHFYCGKGERGEFYGKNLHELKVRVNSVNSNKDYLDVKKWIEETAPTDEGNFDHVTAILEQMTRDPKPLPRLEISKKPFQELAIDDFKVVGYDSHPLIKKAMAV